MSAELRESMGGLLEGLEAPVSPSPAPRAARPPSRLTLAWRRKVAAYRADPAFRKRVIAGASILTLAAGVGLFFLLRPMPKPDYDKDRLDTVFKYTLLTEQFNALPVEERMRLIGQLVQRLKSMSTGDSLLMASFAAGIAGNARQQIERNASRLAIDSWDKYAKSYNDIPDDRKGEYLDQTLVEFSKTMEALGGRARDLSDEDRLAEVKREIAREKARISQPGNKPGATDVGRMFSFLDRSVGSHANPAQRSRGALLMRDMGRHLREENLTTGKPKGGG